VGRAFPPLQLPQFPGSGISEDLAANGNDIIDEKTEIGISQKQTTDGAEVSPSATAPVSGPWHMQITRLMIVC
jgi:hypothetical protein